MGQALPGWKCRLAIGTLVITLACLGRWMGIAAPPGLHLSAPSSQPLREEAAAAIVEAAPRTSEERETIPCVSVHVCMIEFNTSSHDAVSDFGTRLQSALSTTSANGPRGGFLKSDELAAVLREFRGKGQVVIRDESPRVIPSGQTDKWGTAMSILATPTLQPQGKVDLSICVEFREALERQSTSTTVALDPGQTLFLGGMVTRATKTETLQVPWLCDDPTVGKWFRYPVTRTIGKSRHFLVSTAIVPEADAQAGAE